MRLKYDTAAMFISAKIKRQIPAWTVRVGTVALHDKLVRIATSMSIIRVIIRE